MCPSCNTRRMVQTAAHLTDHVLPALPLRQWVLSVPKRLRYFLERDTALQGVELRSARRTRVGSPRYRSLGGTSGAGNA